MKREICYKNISKGKYEKLRNYLQWKNSVKLFLERGSLPLSRGNFASQKGTWIIKKGVGEDLRPWFYNQPE